MSIFLSICKSGAHNLLVEVWRNELKIVIVMMENT